MKKRATSTPTSIAGKLWANISTAIGGWFSPSYSVLDPRRKLVDPRAMFAQNRATANQILTSSLPMLRSYCRDLERNNPTARAAIEAVTGLVIGTGIALEPDTGDPRTDDLIRDQWNELIRSCDVDGRDLYTIQQEACRDMVATGEALWRLVVDPDLAKPGSVPIRVLCLESEWLIDAVPASDSNPISTVSGIELDRYARPVKYWLANPAGGGEAEAVESDRMIHIFERRRSMQARGEPWFVPIIETLLNEKDLVDAELYAAKQTAAMALVITSDAHDALDTTQNGTTEDPAQNVRIGTVARMYPGEDVKAFSHTRPSQQIAPFRQMLRGDIAACMRIPQRFLDRDVSRANYSSMRADMLDTDRLLAPVREWFGHATAGRLYKAALPFMALRAGIKPPRNNYRLIPDVQAYIDPLKDTQAAKLGMDIGVSTKEREIGKRGEDYRDIADQAAQEKLDEDMKTVERITALHKAVEASGVPGLQWSQIATFTGAATSPGAYLDAVAKLAAVDAAAQTAASDAATATTTDSGN